MYDTSSLEPERRVSGCEDDLCHVKIRGHGENCPETIPLLLGVTVHQFGTREKNNVWILSRRVVERIIHVTSKDVVMKKTVQKPFLFYRTVYIQYHKFGTRETG